MVSQLSLPVALLYLVLYASTSVASSSSHTASPSYSDAASSSYPSITSSREVAAANSMAAASSAAFNWVSGSAAIESCILEWITWWSDFTEFWEPQTTYSLATPSLLTETSTLYSTYTLCDGIPRIAVDGPLNYTTVTASVDYTWGLVYSYVSVLPPSPIIVSTVITTITMISTTSTLPPPPWPSNFDTPAPNCEVDLSDCLSLYVAASNAMFTGGGINTTASPPLWACDQALNEDVVSLNESPCIVSFPLVQLIYWPVTLASQDLCAYNPGPIDITATQSNTPIGSMFGRNITSDENCYVSYPIVVALFENGTIETQPGDIVAVPSSKLQSFRGFEEYQMQLFTYPFNFADLPPNHVPVLAYEGANCPALGNADELTQYSICETIFEALYAPQLVLPTEIVNKYPQWSNCMFTFSPLNDPPTALVPVDFLTPPSTASSTGASPGWTGDQITPSPTPAPVTQAPSPTVTGLAGSSATAIDSDLGSGDPVTGSESHGYLSIDPSDSVANADPPDSLTNADPPPGTVVTFGTGSVLSPGVVKFGSADSSAPATAVLTLGDGNVVTATSIAGANGFVVGSQTLTAGQAFTTDGTVMSVADGGLLLSSEAFESATGAILTANSETITALESVNNRGSTVIDIGGIGEIVVGGPAITLASGGIVLSAGVGGLVITDADGITTVLYSTMMVTSTPLQSSTSPRPTTAIAVSSTTVTSTSKMSGSSRAGIGMGVLVMWLFLALGLW